MKLNNEQKKALYEEGYKFCFDVVKLILGGIIFAGIMQDNIDRTRLYAWGVFFMVLIVALGMYFIIKSKNKIIMDLVDFLGLVTALIVVPGLAFILWDNYQEKKAGV